nr:endonuclease domain-containing protein [Roseibium aestuarii]
MKKTTFARHLRRNATDAEQLLWYHLRNRGLNGWKFRCQVPVGPYVADFVCKEAELVVELDGGHHSLQADQDAARTLFLESVGFRVVRFWNNQVLQETQAVLEIILLQCDAPMTPAERHAPGHLSRDRERSERSDG